MSGSLSSKPWANLHSVISVMISNYYGLKVQMLAFFE